MKAMLLLKYKPLEIREFLSLENILCHINIDNRNIKKYCMSALNENQEDGQNGKYLFTLSLDSSMLLQTSTKLP